MTLVFVNQGEALALQYLVNAAAPQDLVLRLFQNDVTAGLTPAQIEALTEASFTEANFTGYASVTLTGASWTVTGGDPTQAAFAPQQFTSTANQTAQTIFGYHYTRVTGGQLVAFEEFAAPVIIEFLDDTILVTPQITGRDEQDV